MGVLDTANTADHKTGLRESKGEILFGELIRGLSEVGWRPYRIVADSDRHAVGFKVPDDPLISTYSLVIPNTAGSAISASDAGSRSVIGFVAEMHNPIVDLDTLAAMWQGNQDNAFRLPAPGEVRVDHQLNRVVARTHDLVDLDQYFTGGGVSLAVLVEWARGRLLELGAVLKPLAAD